MLVRKLFSHYKSAPIGRNANRLIRHTAKLPQMQEQMRQFKLYSIIILCYAIIDTFLIRSEQTVYLLSIHNHNDAQYQRHYGLS